MNSRNDRIEQDLMLNELAEWVNDHKIRLTMAQHLKLINVANLKGAYRNFLTGWTFGEIL